MKILLPNKDINILLNQDVSFKNDAGWSENFSEFENDALEQIINPIENYETIRYINKPYSGLTSDPNVNQTDIWFYFYFLSGTTYVPSYEPTGLSNKANSLLTPSTTESFFRLEFYKTPNDELPDNTNRRLVATKTLKIPLSEKFFLTKDNFNKYVHIPIFHGSNYENSENMYFFWFEDDSVLDETNISGNTFWMTVRYFNSVDGSVIAFTNNCMPPAADVIESRDLYYKVVIDKTDYSYQVFDFYGSLGNRTGFIDKPVAFYEIGGGDCNSVYKPTY